MTLQIRPVSDQDKDALLELTLLAFEPIFTSFAQILGLEINPIIYPDWRARQRAEVEASYTNEKINFWVADLEGAVVGYVTYELHDNDKTGEVQLLAVHPDYQNAGIGTALNAFALNKMREAGMVMAVVGTGGDTSHAPARRSYEKAGYTGLPLMRYYQKL